MNPQMNQHWYVIMSQKTVKIYTAEKKYRRLTEIWSFDNPLGRERNRAFIRKQSGSQQFTAGNGAIIHHSADKRHDPHEEVASEFAKKMFHFLESEFHKKSFKTLTVVAEPHFMGKFKSFIDRKFENVVTKWINKDLVKLPKQKLCDYLLPEKRQMNRLLLERPFL